MNNVLSSKNLEANDVSKIISEFNEADYAVRDSSEVKTVVSILMKEQDRLTAKLEEDLRNSGCADISAQLDTIKNIVKKLLEDLSIRVDDAEVSDKTLVKLTKDDVVSVTEGDETRYETNEIVDSSIMFYTDVSYSIPTVEEYNSLSGKELTEEDYFYNLLCKLVDLSLDSIVCYAKKYLSDLDSNVVSEIIEKNYGWHTLVNNFSINKAKLNSTLKMYPEKRNELLTLFYIVKEHNMKTKVPTSAQMSIFDEFDDEEVNVVTVDDSVTNVTPEDGGVSDEQQD